MDAMKLLLRALAVVPGLVQGVEAAFGVNTGAEKKAAVLEMVRVGMNVTDAVTGRHVADADGFTKGLGMVVDGVVECLKASVWTAK